MHWMRGADPEVCLRLHEAPAFANAYILDCRTKPDMNPPTIPTSFPFDSALSERCCSQTKTTNSFCSRTVDASHSRRIPTSRPGSSRFSILSVQADIARWDRRILRSASRWHRLISLCLRRTGPDSTSQDRKGKPDSLPSAG